MTYTTRIKRTLLLAGVVTAVVVPSASARPVDGQNVPAPAPLSHSVDPGPVPDGKRYAEMAADRDALQTAGWQKANPATVIEVTAAPDGSGGLDIFSIALGAAIAFILILGETLARWTVRRRRSAAIRTA